MLSFYSLFLPSLNFQKPFIFKQSLPEDSSTWFSEIGSGLLLATASNASVQRNDIIPFRNCIAIPLSTLSFFSSWNLKESCAFVDLHCVPVLHTWAPVWLEWLWCCNGLFSLLWDVCSRLFASCPDNFAPSHLPFVMCSITLFLFLENILGAFSNQ